LDDGNADDDHKMNKDEILMNFCHNTKEATAEHHHHRSVDAALFTSLASFNVMFNDFDVH
jgi:hypothetical protein